MATKKQQLAKKKYKEAIKKGIKSPDVKKIMLESGYASSTAQNFTNKLLRTKGWNEMLDITAGDALMALKFNQLLTAVKLDHYVFPRSIEDEDIKKIVESVPGCRIVKINKTQNWKRAFYWIPDNFTVARGLDMLMKSKGRYQAPSLIPPDDEDLSPDEMLEQIEMVRQKIIATRKVKRK